MRRVAIVAVVALACACACASSGATQPQPPVPPRASLPATVTASQLRVEAGRITTLASGALALRSPGIRAVVGDQRPRAGAELAFTYRGPTAATEPLASGELRRQIGLKLRAQDTCNVVYVMWHIAPTAGLHVSVKANPTRHDHAACGDGGYLNLTPAETRPVAPIRPGEPHRLAARIDGERLEVAADGVVAWQGRLPPEAFRFDGPVGLRSDNGEFDIQLRISENP